MKPAFKAMKLEDIKELQELVAGHIDSVEPGLGVLDSRVLLGGATVDLLALDAREGLTLIALGFVAEDEMLLRALEAYSWCLEYPDALRRLYPKARLSLTEPPRVIFIAERVPDAFLRKIRHMRFHRADCLEFRFGLQFNQVDGARGTDERVAHPESRPAEPVRASTPEPVVVPRPAPVTAPVAPPPPAERIEAVRPEPEPVEMRSGLHENLRAPDEGNLSPQWHRALTRTSGEVDEWKVKAVREYLQRDFPTAVIYDFYAHDRSSQMFHLQDNQGSVVHTAAIAEELLDELSEAQLRTFLDKHKLARVLRQAGQAGVSVTKSGLKIERR